MKRFLSLLALCLGVTASAEAAPIVTASTDAAALAAAIVGSGITITNTPTLTTATTTAAGTFTGGASSIGFDTGIVLTTGVVSCIGAPGAGNTQDGCTGGGTTTELSFQFTSDTDDVFFSYVFGSEEYNEYVNAGFNDQFELLLNGTNIALLPGGGGIVSIDNVNCVTNAASFRNNDANVDDPNDPQETCPSLGIDIEYDGLTTVLTAQGTAVAGTNTFVFRIFDVGDSILDSGVFIQGGSFSSEPPDTGEPGEPGVVPEPASMFLVGTGLAGVAIRRWRQRKA